MTSRKLSVVNDLESIKFELFQNSDLLASHLDKKLPFLVFIRLGRDCKVEEIVSIVLRKTQPLWQSLTEHKTAPNVPNLYWDWYMIYSKYGKKPESIWSKLVKMSNPMIGLDLRKKDKTVKEVQAIQIAQEEINKAKLHRQQDENYDLVEYVKLLLERKFVALTYFNKKQFQYGEKVVEEYRMHTVSTQRKRKVSSVPISKQWKTFDFRSLANKKVSLCKRT